MAWRVWLQIRGLFGGTGDDALLQECGRGLDGIAGQCCAALRANLPRELHAAVQRQLEQAQRHADHVRRLRQQAAPSEVPGAGAPSLSQ